GGGAGASMKTHTATGGLRFSLPSGSSRFTSSHVMVLPSPATLGHARVRVRAELPGLVAVAAGDGRVAACRGLAAARRTAVRTRRWSGWRPGGSHPAVVAVQHVGPGGRHPVARGWHGQVVRDTPLRRAWPDSSLKTSQAPRSAAVLISPARPPSRRR